MIKTIKGGKATYCRTQSFFSGERVCFGDIVTDNTYATGQVAGIDSLGGLVGYNQNTIASSFAAAPVVSEDEDDAEHLGGVIGDYEEGDVTDTYFDGERTGQPFCTDTEDELGDTCFMVNPENSQPNYFLGKSSNAPLNDWDFLIDWQVNAGDYPTLRDVGSHIEDSDADGVSDVIENAGPNGGDANNDGAPDAEQANVTSPVDPYTNNYAVLQTDQACAIQDIDILAESSTTADAGFTYLAGLMNFILDCGTPGFAATITQYYYGVNVANLVARKFKQSTSAYLAIPSAVLSSVTIGGQTVAKVVFSITDGAELDDATADGVIVDPSGLAANAVGAPNTGLGRQ